MGDDSVDGATIENYYLEERSFPPDPDFVAHALVSDPSIYDRAEADPAAFWAEQARDLLSWDEDFHTTLEWDLPDAKWFVGGKLNVSYNCLDRHVEAGLGERVAFHWEGEPGDARTITYADLLADVARFANVLRRRGVQLGDRVCIYMPMIPETVVAMLACTRIGAVHTVVFGGFSPDSLIDRINDGEAVLVVTADGGYRRGEPSLLKPNVDVALADCPSVRTVVVVDRCGVDVDMTADRDHWWHEEMDQVDRRLPARPGGQRASPVPPLHLGDHGATQGDHAHDGRLPGPGGVDAQGGVRPEAGHRCVLVRRRCRLGHGPQLHRVRPAGERGHVGHVRGHPRHAPVRAPGGRHGRVVQGPHLGHHRALRRDAALHRAHRDPDLHEVGGRRTRAATT